MKWDPTKVIISLNDRRDTKIKNGTRTNEIYLPVAHDMQYADKYRAMKHTNMCLDIHINR